LLKGQVLFAISILQSPISEGPLSPGYPGRNGIAALKNPSGHDVLAFGVGFPEGKVQYNRSFS
jgi:hypothetical protein